MMPSIRDRDLIWVHDYHLMLLPALLQDGTVQSQQKVKLGFFLHTPFLN